MEQQKALTEERIREIIREELITWEKKQVQARRFGLPVQAETKSPPHPRVDKKLTGEG